MTTFNPIVDVHFVHVENTNFPQHLSVCLFQYPRDSWNYMNMAMAVSED